MRQGEVASQGKWTGTAFGGVKTPDSLILPNPPVRFAQTAERLAALSNGHPMAEWLRFMSQLAQAQHSAAITMCHVAGPTRPEVEQAVDAGIPPLDADGHRRDPAWRNVLAKLLDALNIQAIPPVARTVMTSLRDRGSGEVEALADGFLRGGVDACDAGAAIYVAAALQVYFSHLTSALPGPSLRLLRRRGLCPCCGSPPVSGVVTARGQVPGTRYLYCSLCGTAWVHVRAACITCGHSRCVVLREVQGQSGAVKAETCDDCRTYAKMLYQAQDMKVDPFADDLATLRLDLLVAESGWARHAPNPLVLIGDTQVP
jgi:FdhE protein